MNEDYENPTGDDELESVLSALTPASGTSESGQSDGQLMYAMGYAVGKAAASDEPELAVRAEKQSSFVWQLATVAATLIAATFAVLLFTGDSEPNVQSVAMSSGDAANQVSSEVSDLAAVVADSNSKTMNPIRLNFLSSFFANQSTDSAFGRRAQIVAAAESLYLDERLEQIASAGSPTWSEKRYGDEGTGLSPRAAFTNLLESDEFQGL